MEKIEGAALGRQERAGVAFDFAEDLIGRDAAVLDGPEDFGCRVSLRRQYEPGRAALAPRFPRDHRRLRPAAIGDQFRRQVAGADIFPSKASATLRAISGARVGELDMVTLNRSCYGEGAHCTAAEGEVRT